MKAKSIFRPVCHCGEYMDMHHMGSGHSPVEMPDDSGPPDNAWFWSKDAGTLFVGYSGQQYPGSREIETCDERPSKEQACEVFTRQIAPWASQLIPTGKTPTLYFKTVFPPPTN